MNDTYKQLAQELDNLPQGFPASDSGVELKILAKLFTPEEAALARHLKRDPQSVEAVALAGRLDKDSARDLLKSMVKKNLISFTKGDGVLHYKLLPFIVGFYEGQGGTIDTELAELVEQYFDEALHKVMNVKPSVHRVIPIEKTIPLDVEVMPYERASYYIDAAQAWGVIPCICRVQKQLVGKGCDHSVDNCLMLSSKPNAFNRSQKVKALSKDEALKILEDADKEGLIHSTGNHKEGVTYICNCCSCSCGVLRGMTEYGHLNAVGASDFLAVVDEELCSGCEVCVDRCHFKALHVPGDVCFVESKRCYGCGLCVSSCPTGAITLITKSVEFRESLALDESSWEQVRAEARVLID